MELIVASVVGILTAAGVYLVLRLRTFPVILGTALLSYAVNVFLFASGRLVVNMPPVLRTHDSPDPANYTDPLPQALVLTAIVIGFGTTAFALVLTYRVYEEHGTIDLDELGETGGEV